MQIAKRVGGAEKKQATKKTQTVKQMGGPEHKKPQKYRQQQLKGWWG